MHNQHYANNVHSESPRPAKFGAFDVFYKSLDSCTLGDVIHGWVEINLYRPIVVQRMTVTFYGEVQYQWGRNIRTAQFDNQSQELWRQPHISESGARLESGFYVYEFYVGTRVDLPGSFLSKSGSIQSLVYYCEVRIAEQTADGRVTEHIKRKPLFLKASAMCHNDEQITERAVVEKGMLYVRNLLDMSGCIAATVLVSKRQAKPGENLTFSVEILNCFRKLKTHVSLIQKAKIVNHDGLFETIRLELYRMKLGNIKSSETYKQWFAESIWIPDPELVPVHLSLFPQTRKIFLGYSLLLTVTPLIGKKLEVEVPLVVKSNASPPSKFPNGTICSGAATI